MPKYIIHSLDGQEGIECQCCGRTSWHPDDVKYRYCGFCHTDHSLEELKEQLKAQISEKGID